MRTRTRRLTGSSLRVALSFATAALVAAACGGGGVPSRTTNASGGGTVTPQSTGSNTTPTNTPTGNTDTGGNASNGSDTNMPTNGSGGTVQPPSSPCDGLVPTFGAASGGVASGPYCDYATSSPWGQVAISECCDMGAHMAFNLYSPSGEGQGRITGLPAWTTMAWRPGLELWFSWTSHGYVGLAGDPGSGRVTFWDDHGVPVAVGPIAVALAPDGAGGTVALTRYDATTDATQLSWFDASGRLIRSAAVDGSPRQLIVNWATHHVLTIEGSETARARWYDGSGAPIGDWIQLGRLGNINTTPALHLLVDGSIAIGERRWLLVLHDGAPSADPAPAWLADLPTTWLATIRDGRAYATGDVDGGLPALQILTPDGVKCGTVPVPHPSGASSASSPSSCLTVGQDGTVIEMVQNRPDAEGCLVRWWPALLR